MTDSEVPEAILTATFQRVDNQQATVLFDAEFSRLFGELDKLLPGACAWARRQSQSFRWAQPETYRRPTIAVTDPTCPGKRVPGTRYGISTMGFIFQIDCGCAIKIVDPLYLNRDELTQFVDALNKLRLKKRS